MKLVYLIKKAKNIYCDKWWTLINKVSFKLNGIAYGSGIVVRGKVYAFFHSADAVVRFGNDVHINSAGWANPIGCGERVYIQMVDACQLIIGNNCGISNCAFTCANNIKIEDNVLLGSGCKIYDTDFHALDYEERVKGNYPGAPIKTAPVVIEEGAFIGAGSMILKGVTIGKHSIVGAGAVVTKSIPAGEIWGGNPAKYIRKVEEND